jgi:hypothetical protein
MGQTACVASYEPRANLDSLYRDRFQPLIRQCQDQEKEAHIEMRLLNFQLFDGSWLPGKIQLVEIYLIRRLILAAIDLIVNGNAIPTTVGG